MMSKDKYIGKIYTSNNFGDVEILSLHEKRVTEGGSKLYYTVKFIDTGNIGVFERGNILRGRIRDVRRERFTPRVSGVGFVGDLDGGTKDKNIRPIYNRWVNMLSRVYNTRNSHYEFYGGSGVTVDERWHNFSNFYRDVQSLEGFDLYKITNEGLELDKDMKQLDSEVKVYSKDTCIWVSREENSKFKMNKQFKFKAIDPEGKEYESYSIRGFSREHNLPHRTVTRVLSQGKVTAPSLDGWKFYKMQ
ncbi:HNH endonuclease [Bacillus phage vB_BceH_LY2]|nr:HNH endonuclease [Bacillus phage vB_BceH_LY2]